MTNIFRKKLLHVLPAEDNLGEVDYYLSRSWLPGMLPIEDLGLKLYGAPLHPFALQEEVFYANPPGTGSGDGGGRRDIVSIGVGTGGCIQEWVPGDGPQLFNHAGNSGRSMQQTFFVSGGGVHLNPTMAGDKFDAYFPDSVDPKVPAPPLNYSQRTLLHGARMIQHERTANFFKTVGIPLEWDPDGVWFGHNHGGGVLDAVEYPDLRFGFAVDMHWKKPGLHRVISTAVIPEVPRDRNLSWTPLHMSLRFGYDEIEAFNGASGTFTNMQDKPLCDDLETVVVSWQDKGRFLLGTLRDAHGRQAETRQNVLYGQAAIGESSIFMDDTRSGRVRIDPKPLTHQLAPARVSAPRAVMAEFEDIQMRYGYQNRVAIGGGSGLFRGKDQSGGYPVSIFGERGNAVIYTSRVDSTNPWSFRQDFSIALFLPWLDKRSGDPKTESQRHLRWASKRGAGVPQNGKMDQPVVVLADTNSWNAGLPRPSGRLTSTAYLCMGTRAEVREMLTYLVENGR